MKVCHLVSGDLNGGAARGAYWLHQGLLELGIDSVILNKGNLTYEDETVISLTDSPIKKAVSVIGGKLASSPKLLYLKRKSWIFNTGFDGVNFEEQSSFKAADIIHLHWINGLVSTRALKKICKPVVWTLRDMWPLTGGCHYAMGCGGYLNNCGKCPQLGSNCNLDLSRLVLLRKKAAVPKHIHLVGISNWISQCAKDSAIFRGLPVHTISNNIDTQGFFPIEPKLARHILGLPIDKKVILVGSLSLSDFYKGFELFLKAVEGIKRDNIHVLLFGRLSLSNLKSLHCSYSSLGLLNDIISMRLAYSAADLFVAPSRMDAFGKTLAEAMACGTPVVCFDATGPADVVEHRVTGYKAKPFDPSDLQAGIEWILSLPANELESLGKQARRRVVTLFDSQVIASQYLDLYKQILSNS